MTDQDNDGKSGADSAAPDPDRGPQSESSELFNTAIDTGIRRLRRPSLEMGVSGFIAGMNVTFGALAAAGVAGAVMSYLGEDAAMLADVLGAVVFPIGFVFVVIGRSELFTENFLVPTAAVIARAERVGALLRLWALTLLGNLGGAFMVAFVISLEHYHGVPGVQTILHIQHTAEFLTLGRDWDASFFAGIFAGWLITLMTWLLLTARDTISKISIIWCVGFLIMMNKFNHVVVNASEILMAIFTGSQDISYAAWLTNNFTPTILGNMIGGLVFVTLLEYLKIMRSPSRWQ